jgi:hypothetical protein
VIGSSLASDWPQLQCDGAHTRYTPDQPDHPFRVKWIRDMKEPMQASLQPIVAGGKVFVGTTYGNVLAQSWILGKRGAGYLRYVDTTRFTGDLYYVQNLATALDSYAVAP